MSEAQARRERMQQLARDNAAKAERLEVEASGLLEKLGSRVTKTLKWDANFIFEVDGDIHVRTMYGSDTQLLAVIHYKRREESGHVNLDRYARSFEAALVEIERVAFVKSVYGH